MNGPEEEELLRLLERQGFEEPDRWLDFARRNRFRRVPARRLQACPSCGAPPGPTLGRYVYYSNRARLVSCTTCGLVWSDLRLNAATLSRHFGRSYKSERYFEARASIFDQVADRVDRLAPEGARVLDVGGATGHLMNRLRQRRPDLAVTVNDVSEEACSTVRRRFGFRTIHGSIADLGKREEEFDVLVLCDVIYYEPELAALWSLLRGRVAPGGAVLLRVPNKLALITLAEKLRRWIPTLRSDLSREAGISFFNPEHLFIFPRSFLERKLSQLGYRDIRVGSSRLFGNHFFARLAYRLLSPVAWLTGGRVIATPSMILTARKPAGSAGAQ